MSEQCTEGRDTFQQNEDVHSNIRQFQCTFGGKRLKTKDHQNAHVLTHRNEQQHDCDQCDQTFISSSFLEKTS